MGNELVCKVINEDNEDRGDLTDPATGHSFRVLMEESPGWSVRLAENPRVIMLGKEYEVLITDELREAIVRAYDEAVGRSHA